MSEALPIVAPRENANDEYIILVNWLVEDRASVEADVPVATVESMKTTYEIAAPRAGFLIRACAEGDQVEIGGVLAYVADSADHEPATEKSDSGGDGSSDKETVFTRRAEKMIEELGLDRSAFAHLEIVKEKDVLAHKEREPGMPTEAGESISPTKRFEIDALTRSARSVVYSSVVRALPLEPTQKRVSALASEIGAVSLGECVMHACAQTLRDFPEFLFRFENDRLIKSDKVGLAFAININRKGLRTPVIQDADKLDQGGLSKAVKALALKYLRDELKGDDLQGGTFTVTDLSTMGVTHFNPVINDRQSAILGICAPPPGADWFNLVLAFDHRVADGMLAAQFLEALEARLLDSK